MKLNLHFIFIIFFVIFQSLGGIFGKLAALSLTGTFLLGVFTNLFYILSLGCLVVQSIVWQQALLHFPLSIAYPCVSITNFVVLIFSATLFGESITGANIAGLVLITSGLVVLFHKRGVGER